MTAIYRGMTREVLDRAYDNSGAADDFPGQMRDFQQRSAAFYGDCAARRDLRYGPGARQRFDWIFCGKAAAPVFVFVHGGYWQNCVKEDFAFVAAGPLARGFDVVLAEYTLAPQADMAAIVAEIGQLLNHLGAQGVGSGPGAGKGARPLCLAGHSAGGHLAAMHRAHPGVGAVLAISGLFELEPIRLGRLNDKLGLKPEDVARYSPMARIGAGADMVISVGARELPELRRQSGDYAAACRDAGQVAQLLPVPDCDHFRVLHDLADPQGVQLSALAALMRP